VDYIFGLPGNAVLSRLVELSADVSRMGQDDRTLSCVISAARRKILGGRPCRKLPGAAADCGLQNDDVHG
jgi:hypothetical protein